MGICWRAIPMIKNIKTNNLEILYEEFLEVRNG